MKYGIVLVNKKTKKQKKEYDMKQHHIIFASITIFFPLICMDRQNPVELDLTSAKLPTITRRFINHEDLPGTFKILSKHKALVLKSLVAKEQAGNYCPELYDAEQVLHKIIKVSDGQVNHFFNSNFINDELRDDREAMIFLSLIAEKKMRRECLMIGLQNDDENKCGRMLKNNRYMANAYGSFGFYEDRLITPLHHVLCQAADGLVDHRYAQCYTKMLLEHGANPNACDDAGNTPLHHASTIELIGLLLEFGAKCDECGQEGRTPLQNHIRIRNWDVVRCLLDLFVDVNIPDKDGNTPLHEAVKQKAPRSIIELLVVKGADCEAKNNKQETPFSLLLKLLPKK